MTVTFHIEYRTNWGEEVFLSGLFPEQANENQAKISFPLYTVDGINWTAETDIPSVEGEMLKLSYRYQIMKGKETVREEWTGFRRCLYLFGGERKKYRIIDSWKDIPEDLYLYSSAFTESLLAHPARCLQAGGFRRGVIIKAYAPRIGDDYAVGICGSVPALGNWDPERAVLMSDAYFPEWHVELDADKLPFPFEYKFVLYNKKTGRVEGWEQNPNRLVADYRLEREETLVVSDRYVHFDLPLWRGAGVAVPVFSLKSEHSFGIGDFGDLKRLVDWAVCTGQQVIQILPVNDTTMSHTWQDSYPYNSNSIYAFHPLYLDLEQLGRLGDPVQAEAFRRKQKELNALPQLDYEAVEQAKWEYFRLIFAQEGKRVLASDAFLEFFAGNREWLKPYAVFCCMRDRYRTADFRQWPECQVCRPDEVDALCSPGSALYPEIALHFYLQFNLHVQLLEASRYARSHRVVLKGDIPIGISRNSVEAWAEPHYFNLNGQAGAPPDDFSKNGQNWGFPTYNWEVMKKDGYSWWMKRFKKMAEYFDAYRIDHILGFFRIWEIPAHAVHGLLGQFVPALPLTREEIESYGLPFRDNYLKPYIHEHDVCRLFGPLASRVKDVFLLPAAEGGLYELRPEFDTQRKVEAFFHGRTDEESLLMREGLYTLISHVLFVRDHREVGKYHPRISARQDMAYHSLSQGEQQAFDRLYEDYYYHRHNEFWRLQAMEKLPRLTQSTRMLVCGEDLGMIPACVPRVMNDLRILSLEIERMPKDLVEFGCPAAYPYRSVCTISTHDMATLRGWWEEDHARIQRYYNQVLGYYGEAPAEASSELCEEVVARHLEGNSMLCILSLQDWLSVSSRWRNPDVQAERVNIPSVPRHYWRYRMHLTLEQLMNATEVNEKIKTLIVRSGRG